MAQEEAVANLLRGHLETLAQKGQRHDGRKPDEFRPVAIKTDLINTAEGSAMVTLGETRVLCGVKMIMGTPYPDSPDRGSMATSAELAPLASVTFEAGPPREVAIELSRVVDRGIRESGMIDFADLCVEPGEKAWVVFIDLHILDHGGNLYDCCTLAAAAALTNTTVPMVQHKIGKKDVPLKIHTLPISCTFAKVGETLLLDPALDEERVMNARFTVTHDKDNNLRAMQKGLNGAFTVDEIRQAVKTAREVQQQLRKHIKEL